MMEKKKGGSVIIQHSQSSSAMRRSRSEKSLPTTSTTATTSEEEDFLEKSLPSSSPSPSPSPSNNSNITASANGKHMVGRGEVKLNGLPSMAVSKSPNGGSGSNSPRALRSYQSSMQLTSIKDLQGEERKKLNNNNHSFSMSSLYPQSTNSNASNNNSNSNNYNNHNQVSSDVPDAAQGSPSPLLGRRLSVLLPTRRSVEDKVETLVALRERITQALREIYVQLEKVDHDIKHLQEVDADFAKRLRELVKFLRSLVSAQDEATSAANAANSRASMLLRSTGSTISRPDRLEFFKEIMTTALVEIRCKLGSLQKRVATATSLSTTVADAHTIRSVKLYLDGKGTLEIDPNKHKVVLPAPKPSQQDKYMQLIRATKFSSNDIMGKLQLWVNVPAEVTDTKMQALAAKRAKEIKETFDGNDEEEVYSGDDQQSPRAANNSSITNSATSNGTADLVDTVKYIIAQIENNTRIVVEAEENKDPPSSETFAFIIRFARKLRQLKKYMLRAEREDGALRGDDHPVGLRRLIELLNKERNDPKEESNHYEIQEDISALNTRRHLLTLSIRNLDRKINFLIKSRKHKEEATEMEEEEVYQFFDQTTSEENPLGKMKEHYEQFISILRKQPRYLASIVPFMSFGEMDGFVQTITFSLFSDLYLAREEYLMLSLIEAIMKAEFVTCKEVDQYLRSNSFITKLLAGYTKRQSGRLHLVQALRASVLAVVQDSALDLEMDTSKLYKTIVLKDMTPSPTPKNSNKDSSTSLLSSTGSSLNLGGSIGGNSSSDKAGEGLNGEGEKGEDNGNGDEGGKLSFQVTSEHPDVKRVFNEHKFKLIHFCKLFLDNIINSIPTMPFGIRWIAQQLASKAREKFPDVTDIKIDLLIGGFIFLRYLCPAIVAPESHGLVSHITQKARRNLILIAKVLQNLANNFPFSKKEPFMSPMNTFLEDNQLLLHDYFVQVLNVGDYTAYYKMSSLKRAPPHQIERTVTISPNELYDIHRKLTKHESAVITSKTDDSLATLLTKMGPAPENLPRRQNKFVLLNVYSMPEQDNSAQEASTEELFVQNLKEDLTKALGLITPPPLLGSSSEDANNLSLYKTIDSAKSNPKDPSLPPLLTDISQKLEKLPPLMKENNFMRILHLVEKDYQQRVIVREALLTEKVEQLEALDHQKREVARLLEEKKIYSQYLQNVMLDAYVKKIKNKPMIGPYKFSIQQLERRGVIVPSPNLATLRNTVEIKMSCTNPGSINITTKYRKFSRFFELQLLDLMDDLVLHDTVNYDEIIFDTRKLISFINKYILG